MFCHKCGAQMDNDSKFCSVCGAPQADFTPEQRTTLPLYNTPTEQAAQPGYIPQSYIQQPAYAPYDGVPMPVKKKSHLKAVIPACILLVAAISAALYFFILTPKQAAVDEALAGLKSEMSDRLNTTPLKVLGDLTDAIGNGSVSADFYSLDYYGGEVSGNLTLQTDIKNRDFAIMADLDIYGQPIELSAYVNEDRVAVGSPMLGSNYLGFTYDTFRQDIRSFGSRVGIDEYSMGMLADAVDTLNEMMNQEAAAGEVNEAYGKAMDDFVDALKPVTTNNAGLPYGSSSAKYKKVDYVVSKDAFVGLLNEYCDILIDDDGLRAQFETILESAAQYGGGDFGAVYGSFSYSELISGLKMLISTIEYGVDGSITVSFYLDGSRLVCMSALLKLEVGVATGQLELICDFGAKSGDPWVFTFTVTEPDGGVAATASIRWDYSDSGDKYVNKLTFATGDGRYSEEFSFATSWSKTSGAFSLSYSGGGESGKISGNLKETSDGFVLKFDNLGDEYYGEVFDLTITVKKGGTVDAPAYMNIDMWDEDLIYMIGQLLGGASGMF